MAGMILFGVHAGMGCYDFENRDSDPRPSRIESGALPKRAYPIALNWKTIIEKPEFSCHQPHREPVSCVALSVDLLWVFSVSHDDLLKMYSMEEMRVTRSIQVWHNYLLKNLSGIRAIAFTCFQAMECCCCFSVY